MEETKRNDPGSTPESAAKDARATTDPLAPVEDPANELWGGKVAGEDRQDEGLLGDADPSSDPRRGTQTEGTGTRDE